MFGQGYAASQTNMVMHLCWATCASTHIIMLPVIRPSIPIDSLYEPSTAIDYVSPVLLFKDLQQKPELGKKKSGRHGHTKTAQRLPTFLWPVLAC